MSSTRVKICGITRLEDAALAAELGAHAIGLNFVGGPRQLTEAQSNQIYWALYDVPAAQRPQIVALVDIDRESPKDGPWHGHLQDFAHSPDAWQVYTSSRERLLTSRRFLGPETWWLVAPVHERQSLGELNVSLSIAGIVPTGIVLDTASPGLRGGTGQSFNWHWIAEARDAGELNGLPPIILAGGLTPENVAQAIQIARPYAVDVSSGVEVAGRPGIKDPAKMRDFIQAAHSV